MQLIPHYINGERHPSLDDSTIDNVDPVTGKPFARIADGRSADADRAVRSCRAAATEWAQRDPSERGNLLWALANLIEAHRDDLAQLDSRDVGKPYLDCAEDVNAAVKLIRFYAGLPDKIRGSTMPVQPGFVAFTEREPYGIIAAIVPWNYPIFNACAKVGAIIAMGNTCVLKPAEEAPSSAVLLAELAIQAGFPPGVLNVLNGGAAAGEALTRHMDVDKISFTGSTETGRRILKASAESNLKACSLELGGKSPNIIFADADLDAAAESAAFSVFYNQGQTCTAATRMIVARSVVEPFTEKLVERARAIKVGNPLDEATQLGPLVSEEQFTKVLRYVELGRQSGAVLRHGGARVGNEGFFFQPTVFTDVPPTSEIAMEEIFGPVATIMAFDEESEAVELANSVSYGLAASVWTKDVATMHRLVRQIHAGIVWGNCLFAEHPSVPAGGFRQSGFGKEYGLEAGYEYTRAKSVWINLTGDVLRWTGVHF